MRKEIIDRVVARRGRLHLFDKLEAKRTALLVIDMQNAFVAPGAPVEVPAARAIVEPINRLAAALRKLGVPVIGVQHETARTGRASSTCSSPPAGAPRPPPRSPPARRCRRCGATST